MQEVNFGADLQAAEKEFNIGKGSDKFKFKEGENRVRVLSPSVPLQNTYMGETRVKFVTWLWDYSENALRLGFLPISIVRAIAALQAKPDYAFTEVPMPYDLLIDAKNAGTIDVEYTVTAARTNSEVPQEAIDALAKEKPVAEVVALIQQKNAQQDPFVYRPSCLTALGMVRVSSAPIAVIETQGGTLKGPDFLITITETASKPKMTAKRQVSSSQR